MGVIVSIIAHVVSWMSPNLLHFAVIGVPLQIISMILMAWLYHKRVMPLQEGANLRWWEHASSLIHGLMFLSVLSLFFHGAMLVLHISSFLMFLIRSLSSVWLYTFTACYGYSHWANRYGVREKESHLSKFEERAYQSKTDIQAQVTTTSRHTFGRYH